MRVNAYCGALTCVCAVSVVQKYPLSKIYCWWTEPALADRRSHFICSLYAYMYVQILFQVLCGYDTIKMYHIMEMKFRLDTDIFIENCPLSSQNKLIHL